MRAMPVMSRGDLKHVPVVLLLLLVFNTLQVLSAYHTRAHGDIDFKDPIAHLGTFLYSLLSLACSLASWRWVSKAAVGRGWRLVLVFVIAQVLFSIGSTILFMLIRAAHGLSTPLAWIPTNVLFASTSSHFYILGATMAWSYFKEGRELRYALDQVENEKKQLRAQLLKSNLEPHFLFNNLSTMRALLERDGAAAERFLESLSEVYRYFLRHNGSDRVKLKEELAFVQHYITLIELRFGEAYRIELATTDLSGSVLPFAVHTCIENAIKHNAADPNDPLVIRISRHNDHIVVRNSLRPAAATASHKVGLSNLAERYALICGCTIGVEHGRGSFTVELPIL